MRNSAALSDASATTGSDAAGALWLRPAWCVDGDGARLVAGSAVLVMAGRIAACAAAPPGAAVLDLPGLTLLPGFTDLHDYLSVDPDRPDPMGQMHGTDLALRRAVAARHMARDLAAGVTTMRVMGEGGGLDLALRAEAGRGPRLIVSGAPIAAPGSHQAGPEGGYATPEAIARAVDARAEAGVDWIKLVPTGGSLGGGPSGGLGPCETPWGRAHLTAALHRARAHGLPVAVAAHGGPAVAIAAELGAATLEHGAFLDDAALDAVAANGMAVVATLGRFLRPDGMAAAATPAQAARLEAACDSLRRWVPRALARGIRIGLGGDNMHGRQAWDAGALAGLGASPAQAVAALIGLAAQLCGLPDRGFLRPGMSADLVAVEGDPLADPTALQRPAFVMCAGRVAALPPTAAPCAAPS